MASLIRSAKSGSDWSTNELLAYNITLKYQSVFNFFGHELGSIDHLDPNLFSSADPTTAVDFSQETYRFLAYLDLASRANSGQESAMQEVFLRSQVSAREAQFSHAMRYSFYHLWGSARLDLCLVHLSSTVLLIVLEDKSTFSPSNPEPQIVAGAIAAFQYNNQMRANSNLPQLNRMVIPCITMVGTRPFFYKIPVTQQLSDCVATGQFPSWPTFIVRCAPPARRGACEGMEVLDYRRIALQYYNAFRGVARDYWATLID